MAGAYQRERVGDSLHDAPCASGTPPQRAGAAHMPFLPSAGRTPFLARIERCNGPEARPCATACSRSSPPAPRWLDSAETRNLMTAERTQSPLSSLSRELSPLRRTHSAGDGVDGTASAGFALSSLSSGGGAHAADRDLGPGAFETQDNPVFDRTPLAAQRYMAYPNAVWSSSPCAHTADVDVNAVATLKGVRLCELRFRL